MPENNEILQELVPGFNEDPATSIWCKDHNSLRSTNFVILFESENLVDNLIEALRCAG